MSEVENRIQQVRQSYIDALPAKLQTIQELWNTIKLENFAKTCLTQQEEFFSLVHSISGSGAMFGFTQLSNTAKPLEKLFSQLQANKLPAQEHIEQVNTLISVLHETVQNIMHNPGEFNTDDFTSIENIQATFKSNEVYILAEDHFLVESISAQLTLKKYQPLIFSIFDEMYNVLTKHVPLAIIIDNANLLNHKHSTRLSSIRQHHTDLSITCISHMDNMSVRLDALRAGANNFFVSPLDSSDLISALDSLVEQEQDPLYRVLIIDDDETLACLYSSFLEQANILVEIVTDPRLALEKINQFNPELILLDIYMPHINGFEIARLIRQIPELDTISIIFMSTEQDTQRQLAAIDHVGDFLKKPVWPDHLITTVISKCRHARKLIQTQKKLKNTLREYEFQKLAMDQHSIISITDANGNITYINHMFCDISGHSEEELIGNNHRLIKSDEHNDEFYSNLWQTISKGEVWHGEIKNRTKDGNDYWVESTIVPFLDDAGIPYQYISIRTDITKIKNAELEQIQSQKRLQEQNTSLAILTNREKLFLKDKYPAYRKITELVSETLHIDRSSIWFFDNKKDTLSCEYIYDSNNSAPETKLCLNIKSFPVFLSSLTKERIIVARDALSNPITQELSEYYLSPFNIKSIMAAGIYYEGNCIGTICFESVNENRKWWPEDKNYITTIADYIALLTEQWERQIIQDQLVIAKEKAEKASKAKSDFLSRMSHELRTPLNAIIGFSQLIDLKPENLSTTQKDGMREILNAGRHLLELINGILDLSAVESGKMQVTIEPVDPQKIIYECLQLISPLVQKRSITIVNSITDGTNPSFLADHNKVKQVIINLLSNAIKYNINNGKIFISSNSDNNVVSLVIEDTGYGIPDDKMSSLFKPFERSGSGYHHIEGTGIGLAISKNLMKLMGGSIGCTSTVGVGSKFWIKLPKYNPGKLQKDDRKPGYTQYKE